MNMLDNLPKPLRHAILVFAGSVLAYVTAEVANNDLGLLTPVAATLITMAGLYLTKLTKQYGVGSNDEFVDDEDVEDAEI